MIGLRTGLKTGLRSGLAAGIAADPISGVNPMSGVTQDATSLKYWPSSSAEWTTALAAAGITSGNPSNLWNCQDASTSLTDAIGAVALDTIAFGSFQQAVTGWTRKAFATTNDTALSRASNSTIGNVTTSSGLLLAYIGVPTMASSEASLMAIGGGADHRYAAMTTTPRNKAVDFGNTLSATGTAAPGTTVHPVIVQVDRTAGAFRVITDQEVLAPAYVAPAASSSYVGLGDAGVAVAAGAVYLGACRFAGAAAEIPTAKIKTLFQMLGWSVAW